MDNALAIQPLIADDDLAVWARQGDSGLLVVCFSGIGKDAEPTPPIEFAKTATADGRHSALFVSDPHRSWLNAAGIVDRIVQIVSAYSVDVSASRIATLGHSMGGFCRDRPCGASKCRVISGLCPADLGASRTSPGMIIAG